MAFAGMAKRQAAASRKGRSKTATATRKRGKRGKPTKAKTIAGGLFIPEEGVPLHDLDSDSSAESGILDEDAHMVAALQASLEEQEAEQLRRAIEISRKESATSRDVPVTPGRASSSKKLQQFSADLPSDDEFTLTPSRLATALSFANTGQFVADRNQSSNLFSKPNLLRLPSENAENEREAEDADSEDDLEEVEVPSVSAPSRGELSSTPPGATDDISGGVSDTVDDGVSAVETFTSTRTTDAAVVQVNDTTRSQVVRDSQPESSETLARTVSSGEERWSRSPSPEAGPSGRVDDVDDHFDAAAEMNPREEEGDFARFVSQVQGKDLDTVRREIDDEIRTLNQQKKAAMRDSEDVTQAIVSQIMV